MKIKISHLLVCFAVLMAISACKIRDANAGPDKTVKICKNTNEVINDAYGGLTIPDHLRQMDPVKYPDDFKIDSVISALTTLQVNEAFLVDYVYEYRGVGARPLLYSLPISKKVFKSENEYDNGKPLPFTYGIETDGTELGFLQLAMFDSLGPGFYLYWHAGYNDEAVLCDIDDVEATLDELDRMDFGMKPNLVQKAMALTIPNIEPTISFDDKSDQVSVSMLMFTKWGGFYRRTYTFKEGFPHKILNKQDQFLIEYDCGVKF